MRQATFESQAVRAVVQLLNGRNAGRRFAVAEGVFSPGGEPSEIQGPTFLLGPLGWTVTADDVLRVNGRQMSRHLLCDRDILGYRGRLYRFHLLDDPALREATPFHPPTARRGERPAGDDRPVQHATSPRPSPRMASGFSTVVTAPGRWGDLTGRWYDDAVFRISGREQCPEELLGRLQRRMRCHLILVDAESVDGQEAITLGPVRLKPLASDIAEDVSFIRRLWNDRRLIALLSPLEPDMLVQRLRPFASLLGHPESLAPLLRLPERSLLKTLREADAALLFGRPDAWELFCCPEMLPAWRRIGLPAGSDGTPRWPFETIECGSGLVHFHGPVGAVRPADVAAALAERHSLYVLFDGAGGFPLPSRVPVIPLPPTDSRTPLLVSPGAEAARFELTDALWGRGVMALVSGRNDRDVVGLLSRVPHWRSPPARIARHLAENPDRSGLGGFEAVLLDAGDGGWSVFGDPRPIPVWRRYGLPSPVIDH